MRQHNENALKVAKFLDKSKNKFRIYPGLKTYENHGVATSQMSQGYWGVLAFGLKADHDTHNLFCGPSESHHIIVSLGHYESLTVFISENDERQYIYHLNFQNGFLPLSVGIEDPEDMTQDLIPVLNTVTV